MLLTKAKSTQRSYGRHLIRSASKLGPLRVKVVEPANVVDVIENSKCTWTEANILCCAAVAMFKHAAGKKIIVRSPASGISREAMLGERPPVRTRLMMKPDELHEILNANMARPNLLSVRILFATTVRVSELYTALRENVDLMNAIRKVATPISTPTLLAGAIDWWLDTGRPPIRRFTPHDARSTAKSYLRKLGVSRDISEMCMNHKLPGLKAFTTSTPTSRNAGMPLSAWPRSYSNARPGQPPMRHLRYKPRSLGNLTARYKGTFP